MQWGTGGCHPGIRVNLTKYVVSQLPNVVFCRYGIDYLRSFPRNDDVTICSYRVNIDYLLLQTLKKTQDNDSKSIHEMSMLKAKGQQ